MDPNLAEASQKLQDALEHLQHELAAIRAGRAHPSLIEDIPVKAYGTTMKLVELGTISAPSSNLLTVQIWDASLVQDIIKAIQEANLGLNPSAEGQLVRLPLPPLTAERRTEFIKLANTKVEEAKIEIRQIRQETRQDWEKQMEESLFGEDEFDRRTKLLQEMIDKFVDLAQELGKKKEEELSEV